MQTIPKTRKRNFPQRFYKLSITLLPKKPPQKQGKYKKGKLQHNLTFQHKCKNPKMFAIQYSIMYNNHHHQLKPTRLTLGIKGWFNMRKSVYVIHRSKREIIWLFNIHRKILWKKFNTHLWYKFFKVLAN